MERSSNQENTVNTPGQTSETVKQLAQRHLADANHQTTDEELRNAKLELHEPVEPTIDESARKEELEEELKELEKRQEKEGDNLTTPSGINVTPTPTTPWDVIN